MRNCKVKSETRVIAAKADGASDDEIRKGSLTGVKFVEYLKNPAPAENGVKYEDQMKESIDLANAMADIDGFNEDGVLVPPVQATRTTDILVNFMDNVVTSEASSAELFARISGNEITFKDGAYYSTADLEIVNDKFNKLVNPTGLRKIYVKKGVSGRIEFSKSLKKDFNNLQYEVYNSDIASLADEVLAGGNLNDDLELSTQNMKSDGLVAHMKKRQFKLSALRQKMETEKGDPAQITALKVEEHNIASEIEDTLKNVDEEGALAYIKNHLNHLEHKLNSGEYIGIAEVGESYEIIELALAAGRTNSTNTVLEKDDLKDPDTMATIAGYVNDANRIKEKLDKVGASLLLERINKENIGPKKVTKEQLFELVDVSAIWSYTRSAGRINNPIIQVMVNMVEEAVVNANVNSTIVNDKIADLHDKIDSDKIDNFVQRDAEGNKTGSITDRFTDAYHFLQKSNETKLSIASPKKLAEFAHVFDPSILFVNDNSAAKESLLKEIKEDLGQYHFDLYYDDAKTKWAAWEVARDRSESSSTPKEHSEFMTKNDPLKKVAGESSAKVGGAKYMTVVGRRNKRSTGESTGYFDESYDTIMNDSTSAELYGIIRKSAQSARSSLGQSWAKFSPPQLAYVPKDVSDKLAKKDYKGALAVAQAAYASRTGVDTKTETIDVNSGKPIYQIKADVISQKQEIRRRVEKAKLESKEYQDALKLKVGPEIGSEEEATKSKAQVMKDYKSAIPLLEELDKKLYEAARAEVSDESSDDFLQAIVYMNISNQNMIAKREIEPTIRLATRLLEEKYQADHEGAFATAMEATDHYLKSKYYNISDRAKAEALNPITRGRIARGELKEGEKVMTDRDLEKAALPMGRLLYMGWSVPTATFNMSNGLFSNIIQVAEGKIGMKDLMQSMWGVGKKSDRRLVKKLFAMGDIGLEFDKQTLYETGGILNKLKSPMVLQTWAETFNQGALTVARLKSIMLTDSTGGPSVSMYDALESDKVLDSKFRLEGYGDRSGTKLMAAVVVRDIRPMIARAHGDYNSPLLVDKSVLGRMGTMFSKYLIEMYKDRLGSGDVNHLGENTPEGRFISAYRLIAGTLPGSKGPALSDVERRRAYVAIAEAAFVLGMLAIAKAITAKACENDTSDCAEQSSAVLLGVNSMNKAVNDLISVTATPYSMYQKSKAPFAIVSAADNVAETLAYLVGNLLGFDDSFYKQDTPEYNQGDSRAWKPLKSLIPVWQSNVNRVSNMSTKLQVPISYNPFWNGKNDTDETNMNMFK